MKSAAIGIVIKGNKVLLVNRKFPPRLWSPPGGFIDEGELPAEAVRREVWEETGIQCKVLNKIHEFTSLNSLVVVYACKYISGEPQCSFESIDIGWFPLTDLPNPISPDGSIFKRALANLYKIDYNMDKKNNSV